MEKSPRLFSRSTNHLRYFEIDLSFSLVRTIQNFESIKREQLEHTRKKVRREARIAPLTERSVVVAGERTVGYDDVQPTLFLVEPAFDGFCPPPPPFRSISKSSKQNLFALGKNAAFDLFRREKRKQYAQKKIENRIARFSRANNNL